MARADASVAQVRVTFVDGTVDEHVPHGGYAVLRGPSPPHHWEAFDARGTRVTSGMFGAG